MGWMCRNEDVDTALEARLHYDGASYPTNPTLHPVKPPSGTTAGEIVVRRFQSFTEGQILR